METQMPEYLKDEYVIPEGENRRELLDSLLAWYWTNWQYLKENVIAEEHGYIAFLNKIDKCQTMQEMKKLVNKYI